MVFNSVGDAKLIDFDLTDKVGMPYPPRFNDQFPERHPKAKSGEGQQKIHDRHSIVMIIIDKVKVTGEKEEKLLQLIKSSSMLQTFFDQDD